MLPGILKRQSSLLKSISAFSFFIAHKHCVQSYQPNPCDRNSLALIDRCYWGLKKDINVVSKEGYSPLSCNSLSFFIDRTKTVRLGENYFFDFWRT